VTPFSLVYSPPGTRDVPSRRGELHHEHDHGRIAGASVVRFANNGSEWNLSGTVGFDLRRIGKKRTAP
jgi:hypothetical protein